MDYNFFKVTGIVNNDNISRIFYNEEDMWTWYNDILLLARKAGNFTFYHAQHDYDSWSKYVPSWHTTHMIYGEA